MGDSDKQMVSFRVSRDTKDQIEQYADDQDISQSEAFRRLVRKGKELENSGITISIDKDSSQNIVTDGGQMRQQISDNNREIKSLKRSTKLGVQLIISLLAILTSLDYFVGRPASAIIVALIGALMVGFIGLQSGGKNE